MKAGDVLLFHRPMSWANVKRDPLGTLLTSLIHLSTRSKWNHAAILIRPTEYAEATSEGVLVTPMGRSTDEVMAVRVDYDDEEDQFTALAWASARVGARYGYFDAFMCGLNSVFVGLGLVIKRTDAVICSELVAECLTRAGDERITKDPALVSPGDLAEALGVAR
jgi:uncharacterized protein YycO